MVAWLVFRGVHSIVIMKQDSWWKDRWEEIRAYFSLKWANFGVPYFPDYKPRLFFKNFRVAAYITVRLMCGRFQKTTHYTLHATACLDQHLITINAPTVLQCSTITDCLCSRVATPPPPAVSLSLSLCVCVNAAVYCTHGQSVGKRPPDVRCWARSSGP